MSSPMIQITNGTTVAEIVPSALEIWQLQGWVPVDPAPAVAPAESPQVLPAAAEPEGYDPMMRDDSAATLEPDVQ